MLDFFKNCVPSYYNSKPIHKLLSQEFSMSDEIKLALYMWKFCANREALKIELIFTLKKQSRASPNVVNIQNLPTDFHTFLKLLVGRICWKSRFS